MYRRQSLKSMSKITNITATKILDSHGGWTIRTKIILEDTSIGVGEVPSGISTGKLEATLLPVNQALINISEKIFPNLKGLEAENQEKIDQTLIELDKTKNKSNLGANAILSVSLAVCDAAAHSQNLPLYKYISSAYRITHNAYRLPVPTLLLLEGGKHAVNQLDFQEFMIIPRVGETFRENLEAGVIIYNLLAEALDRQSYSTAVGVEGGFSPQKINILQAFELIDKIIDQSEAKNVQIALDVAANSLARGSTYNLLGLERTMTTENLLAFYKDLIASNPQLALLEDPFAEEDETGWKAIKKELGEKVEIIGDDILVTNKNQLKSALEADIVTGVIVKPNQIGTLTETIEFARLAKEANLSVVVSHRGGETNSSFIADLAVAVGADYIKTGAPARGERVAKYNRLLEIEKELENSI